jgi:hypothetical protein
MLLARAMQASRLLAYDATVPRTNTRQSKREMFLAIFSNRELIAAPITEFKVRSLQSIPRRAGFNCSHENSFCLVRLHAVVGDIYVC